MPFALAIADLDHFKQLNDKHGHEAGDRALRVFAQATQRALRDGDLLARWGGEEFVIMMPGVDREQAVAALERVRESLAGAHLGRPPAVHRELRRHRLDVRRRARAAGSARRRRPLPLEAGGPRPDHGRRQDSRGSERSRW